jgi:hypothetical protein
LKRNCLEGRISNAVSRCDQRIVNSGPPKNSNWSSKFDKNFNGFSQIFYTLLREKSPPRNDCCFLENEEFAILIPKLQTYFSFLKRPQERKNQITMTLEQLSKVLPGHWSEKNISVWFTNLQKQYMEGDPGCEQYVNMRVKCHPGHGSTLLCLLHRGDIDSGGRRGWSWDDQGG